MAATIQHLTVPACEITCMFPIWLVRILRRSIICGTVVSPERSIVAMDEGIRSEKLLTQ
jgi:hypothetical protein